MPKKTEKVSMNPWGDKAVQILDHHRQEGANLPPKRYVESLAAHLEGLIREAQRAAVQDLEREIRNGVLVAAQGFKTTLDVAINMRVSQTMTRINGGNPERE